MLVARSRLTSKNQISVPEEVRRKLRIEPGSVLEWHPKDNEFIVRKKVGIRASIRRKRARR